MANPDSRSLEAVWTSLIVLQESSLSHGSIEKDSLAEPFLSVLLSLKMKKACTGFSQGWSNTGCYCHQVLSEFEFELELDSTVEGAVGFSCPFCELVLALAAASVFCFKAELAFESEPDPASASFVRLAERAAGESVD